MPGKGAALGLLLATAALAQEEEETFAGRIETEDRTLAITLPEGWRASHEDQEEALVALLLAEPVKPRYAAVRVYQCPGAVSNPWQQARDEAPDQKRAYEASIVEVRDDPIAHIVLWYFAQGEARVCSYAFRRIRGRPIHLQFACAVSDFETLYPGFLGIARTVEAQRLPGKPLPEEYRTVDRGGWTIRAGPALRDKELAPTIALLSDVHACFQKQHGATPAGTAVPPVVVIHETVDVAVRIFPGAKDLKQSPKIEDVSRRLHALPVPAPGTPAATELMRCAWRLLHEFRYPGEGADWARYGESALFASQLEHGTRLPKIDARLHSELLKGVRPLDRLFCYEGTEDWGRFFWDCAAYAAYFTAGPASARKAYRRFLDDVAEGIDGRTALRTRLLAGDAESLRADVVKFLRKLEGVDAKRR